MIAIRPTTITDALLISSNVPENDYPQWSSAITYALGAQVIVTAAGDHHIYKSAVASNLNNNPKLNPTLWTDMGPTNRWAMFDNRSGTLTTNPGTIQVVLNAPRIDAIGFVGLNGITLKVDYTDGIGGTLVYTRTKDLRARYANTHWTYYTEQFDFITKSIFSDMPYLSSGVLTVTLTAAIGDQASIGVIAFGLSKFMGNMNWSSSAGVTDYSIKQVNFAVTTLKQGGNSDKVIYNLSVNNTIANGVDRALRQHLSTPIFWFGTDMFDNSSTFGYYTDFTFSYSPAFSTLTMQIEGLY